MDHPALSISTAFDYSISIEEQIPAIAAAGFSHISLGSKMAHSDYLTSEGKKHLKKLLQQNHLKIDTIHAPCSMELADSIHQLTEVATAAASLGVPIVVVHAGPFAVQASEQVDDLLQKVLQTGKSLEVVSRESGVIFAVENVLPGPATELAQVAVSRLDPACFGFCYDSSHDQIDGPNSFDLLTSFGERLFAVHLSDRVATHVDHVPPWEGFIDWNGLIQTLRQTDYANPLLFEVSVTHSSVKSMEPFLALMYRRACQVHQMLVSAASAYT